MKNLAGNKNSNDFILKELTKAGLVPLECLPEGEVQSKNYSVLKTTFGEIKFNRAWSYWIVTGLIPLDIAEKLYIGELGKRDIRVTGHCGRPNPKEWVNYYTKEGKKVLLIKEADEYKQSFFSLWEENKHKYKFQDSYENSIPCIEGYHIDSQDGLDLFVKTIKEENLCL